jgi:hypothetical protein
MSKELSRWILMKDEKPKDKFFWAFIKGRMEYEGYRDAEIKILKNDYEEEDGLGDLRTLDAACRYAVEGYSIVISDYENVIAWMPLEEMDLPKGYQIDR